MKLIDKAALVAEIRKRFDEYLNSILKHYNEMISDLSKYLNK